MNAMIFAAGLGTRLQPLTNKKPKALVEFKGQPLLWHAINNVITGGVERIVINVHHFADQIINYIESNTWDCEILISDESDCLLDTGGGLLKAKSLFIPNKPILIQNADIVVSTNVKMFIYSHLQSKNLATLMVKQRKTSRYLLFDDSMRLCAWKNVKTKEEIRVNEYDAAKEYGFCGIHMVEPELLDLMGEVKPFSIISTYLDLGKKYCIGGYELSQEDGWFDVGTVEKLREAELNY
ncbi:sugar phosphate nucleotidyltransferase [Carboxylicivirga sp. N1Y90]|uniref:sugar phosphate nucleotidyltransferase n=1 Tax=Carboxylicivirga fragile TaxID=3417571 RepID=UPI003D33CC9A|nr:NTP transferase domain-containing protein [Marinilabiliaceae bacterium N1Y90]